MKSGNTALITAIALAIALSWGGSCMISMPGKSFRGTEPPYTAGEEESRRRLQKHVFVLAGEIGERNVFRPAALDRARSYIRETFASFGYRVEEQTYEARGRESANLIVEIKGQDRPEEIVIVGGHYDSVMGTAGANDNASGAAATLELARLFQGYAPARTLRFIAFVNEEPPFFQTESMGSMVYARRSRKRKEKIVAMLALETMGYYSQTPGSQKYPPPLSAFYPDTGNFIGFVGNFASRSLVRRTVREFRANASFPSEGAALPGSIPGVGWSDHWSFWQVGYPALMVTDTAPFRYPHYHEAEDTPDKIDYKRFARVVRGLVPVIKALAGQ